ncbi:phosphodiesterase/alkaline phosphatase D [Patulibacter medicamentivorans]|uniref:Phosphodiesterase/alkaline phosphatase D n=1 Tax=Patulibacter medicamentivorans TaxID=1097667 RepID=H0EA92_9ACTN|nr:hypothetical protein [Patulibacter medicamentivorans]EHN09432.1 phosphodiesterase/alkaline phosphatase D [Patulibacter medicamentivorans]
MSVPAPALRALAELEPLTRDPTTADLLTRLLSSALVGEVPLWSIAEDPGAAQWLHPDNAPPEWLALLAELVGGRLSPTMSDAQRRTEVRTPSGWAAGLPSTLVTTARAHMQGLARVQVRLRYDPALGAGTDAPGHLQVRVVAADVLPGHEDALERDVLAQVPAWLIGHVEITDEADYDQVQATYPTYDDLLASVADYDDLLDAA